MSRQSFDGVAQEYDAVRPDYPAQLFDALESAMGQPLLRADVLDVGAGTGIASRALAGRGSRVVTVDPGAGVTAVLRARSTSRVRALVGDGNALPLRDTGFDLVTYAQAFHWIDPERAIPEAFRVLRPGGVLALWWNRHDTAVSWYADHEARMFAACDTSGQPDEAAAADLLRSPRWGARVATVEIPWTRRIPLEVFGRCLRTKSYVFALAERAGAVVDAEIETLREQFPGGEIDEPFTTYAVLARR